MRAWGDSAPTRDAALFGVHAGHVNVTDGRYGYMRARTDPSSAPLEEYTLMPTHIRSRFTLAGWEPAEPFAFTKGLRTMRILADGEYSLFSPWRFGTLLFDLGPDPGQEHPMDDPALEMRMAQLLVDDELVLGHLPSLLDGELVSAPRRLSVLGLAEIGLISAGALRRFAEAVGAGPGHADEGGH